MPTTPSWANCSRVHFGSILKKRKRLIGKCDLSHEFLFIVHDSRSAITRRNTTSNMLGSSCDLPPPTNRIKVVYNWSNSRREHFADASVLRIKPTCKVLSILSTTIYGIPTDSSPYWLNLQLLPSGSFEKLGPETEKQALTRWSVPETKSSETDVITQ